MNEVEAPRQFYPQNGDRFLEVLSFKISLPEVEQVYGSAHDESSGAYGEPGPTLYWYFEYSCGLKIMIEFRLSKDYVNIRADQPEIEHILGHINLPMKDVWQIPKDDYILVKYFEPNKYEWQLWRQDDNGHKEQIKIFSREREALCRLRQFEKLHHKQTYWLERYGVKSSLLTD